MTVARWILFSALVWSVGCVTVRWVLIRGSVDGRLARLGLGAAGVALIGVLGLGVGQLLAFRDPFAPLLDEAAVLLGTSWGRSWSAVAVGLVALAAAFALGRPPSRERGRGSAPMWALAAVLSLLVACFPALTGHAAGTERLTTAAVIADALHVVAAGTWIGSLAVLLVLYRPGRGRPEDPDELRSDDSPLPSVAVVLPRFSILAMASVAVLTASGLFAAWLHLPGLPALLDSGYGRILLAKLVLVGGVGALGLGNWRGWVRRLAAGGEVELPARAGLLEVAVAHVILAVTAVLVATPPPMNE